MFCAVRRHEKHDRSEAYDDKLSAERVGDAREWLMTTRAVAAVPRESCPVDRRCRAGDSEATPNHQRSVRALALGLGSSPDEKKPEPD